MNRKVDFRKLFSVVRRSLFLVISLAPVLLIGVIAARITAGILPSLQVYVIKELTDQVAALLMDRGLWTSSMKWAITSAGLIVTGALLDSLNQYMTMILKQKTQHSMEKMLAEKSVHIPLIQFEQPAYFDQLQRAKQNISFRGLHLLDHILSITQSVLTVSSMILVLWQFDRWLAAAMPVIVLPSLLAYMRIGEWKYWLQRFQTPYARRLFYFFDLLTNRAGAKEVRLFRHNGRLLEYWEKFFWLHAGEQRKVERRSTIMRVSIDGLNGGLGLLFTCYAIWVCYAKQLTIGTFTAIVQVLTATQSALRGIAYSLSSIYEESLLIGEFFAFMDTPDEGRAERGQKEIASLPKEIEIAVENLTFSYSSSHRPVLKNISFKIKPKQTIAIVGENGAGKSTLASCLIGLYQNYTGTIRYNGVDIKTIDPEILRHSVSAVFQDFARYQVSVKENIGFGDVNQLQNAAVIEMAAARAGMVEAIHQLPDGMDTLLGPVFEGGHELSVGQWQRLAIARAFMRNSSIVVLDEPTASLDPMAEAELYQRFSELAEERIAVLVSHRLGSCRMADHILVLKEGMVVEQGTHDELMRLGGVYWNMYETQSLSYR